MGVKELWSILDPVKQELPLENLKGQTIAVDLSVWICENNGVKAVQGRVVKPHLRNLFFRVSNLLQLGVNLIFVVDGEAPDLKWETISNRISARFPGRGKGRRGGGNPRQKTSRSHFKGLIRECLEMLDFLGVPYVQSQGEAEAMCALLNEQGIVDACITEDGDVFLYGARWVYRNFNLSSKDPVIASYKMADIEDLGYTRETLVALAMLLGCDFVPKGVPGVGKVHAVNLVSHLRGQDILGRFKDWAKGSVTFARSLPSKPAHCSRCHHVGTAHNHKAGGCPQCGGTMTCTATKKPSPCTCDWHNAKEEFDESSLERDIMAKALQVSGFPNQDVIDEFLVTKDVCPKSALQITRPEMVHMMKFAQKKLEWPEGYTRSKVIDLVTLFDLESAKHSKQRTNHIRDPLLVDHIVKKRTRNGVPCLEMAWALPDSWRLQEDESDAICTIERLDLLKSAHPEIVAEFEAAESNKKGKKKGTKKSSKKSSGDSDTTDEITNLKTAADANLDDVTDQLSRMDLQTEGNIRDILDLVSHSGLKPKHLPPSSEERAELQETTEVSQMDLPSGSSYMPSLRERLQRKARSSRKGDKGHDRIAQGLVCGLPDDSSGSAYAETSKRTTKQRESEEIGRSSHGRQKMRQTFAIDVMDDEDDIMIEKHIISPVQQCSLIDPTFATKYPTAESSQAEFSDIFTADIPVVSGHIQGKARKMQCDQSRENVRAESVSNQDKFRRGGDMTRLAAGRSSCNNSGTFYTTLPAPPEIDTPDVTIAEELLEDYGHTIEHSSKSPRRVKPLPSANMSNLVDAGGASSGESPQIVNIEAKIPSASSLRQRLLLKQMMTSSGRGMKEKAPCSRHTDTSYIGGSDGCAGKLQEREPKVLNGIPETAGLEKTEVYDLVTPDTSMNVDHSLGQSEEVRAGIMPENMVVLSDNGEGSPLYYHNWDYNETDCIHKRIPRMATQEKVEGVSDDGAHGSTVGDHSTDVSRDRIPHSEAISRCNISETVINKQEDMTGLPPFDALSRRTTPEPTLVDVDTPFQTPLQTPTQTPSRIQMPITESVSSSDAREAVQYLTPCKEVTAVPNKQYVSFSPAGDASFESPSTFLTAGVDTPTAGGLSSSSTPNTAPGLDSYATPGSVAALERSGDRSMFQDVNFSLHASLWSPWNMSAEGAKELSGRGHPTKDCSLSAPSSCGSPPVTHVPKLQENDNSMDPCIFNMVIDTQQFTPAGPTIPFKCDSPVTPDVFKLPKGDHSVDQLDLNKVSEKGRQNPGDPKSFPCRNDFESADVVPTYELSTPMSVSMSGPALTSDTHDVFASKENDHSVEGCDLNKVLDMEQSLLRRYPESVATQKDFRNAEAKSETRPLIHKTSSEPVPCGKGTGLSVGTLGNVHTSEKYDSGKYSTGDVLKDRGNVLIRRKNFRGVEQTPEADGQRDELNLKGGQRMTTSTVQDVSRGIETHHSIKERAGTIRDKMSECNAAARDLNILEKGMLPLADKENSPVSLMDRLRKKSTRHRDILRSMELDD